MTFSLPQHHEERSAPLNERGRCADALRDAESLRLPVLSSDPRSRDNKARSTKATLSRRTALQRESADTTTSVPNQQHLVARNHKRLHRRRQHGLAAAIDAVASRTGHATPSSKPPGAAQRTAGVATAAPLPRYALSQMDERVLMLYHASLKHSWALETAANAQQQEQLPLVTHIGVYLQRKYGYEATFAATQIQRIVRGNAARVRLEAFDGPRQQRAARYVQFAFRWLVVCQRIAKRVHRKRVASAVQIQSWYRGCRCRERLLDAQARALVHRIVLFQRHVRGHRFWRVVAALLHDRRCKAATEVQRCLRGWRGRQRAAAIRFEQQRYVRNLVAITAVHRSRSRCANCALEQCTESSLFDCFMARYVGLHDLVGAHALCLDGMRLFPSSGRFCYLFAVLSLVMCDDVGIAMLYLTRALGVLRVSDDELALCEQQYLLPALQLRPSDVAVYLDLAVFCQCSERIARAEAHYAKALSLSPLTYAVPGYLHRLQTLDRLLCNYHRFCSLFNSRQTNVLAKVVAVAKRGSEQLRLMVAKMNQFTAIYPADAAHTSRVNAIYLTDDEVCAFLSDHGSAIAVEKTPDAPPATPPAAASERELALAPKRSLRSLASWRNSGLKSTTAMHQHRTTRDLLKEPSAPSDAGATPLQRATKHFVLVQRFQSEFRGLNVRPAKLAAPSEKRSKLSLSRDHAELLLKHVVFIKTTPSADASEAPSRSDVDASVVAALGALPRPPSSAPTAYVALLPSLLKVQQQRSRASLETHAAVDVQRVFRGFQFRAQVRREKLLQDVQQRQVDRMLAQLHANYVARERRRTSAVAIQRMAKGAALRLHVQQWHAAATAIQRVFRGSRGRKRALAFRDGNCTFYMAERVYQRGMEISGRRVMLSIDKCGLSFRLEGYDLETCTTLPGFVSHASALGLLSYVNWTYAESFVGRECAYQGSHLVITGVHAINRATAECAMACRGLRDPALTVVVPLVDCIQSINLRALSTLGRDASAAEMPLSLDDTARIVSAMTARLVLVHALPMATKELKRATPASAVIALAPPPKMHMLFTTSSASSSRPGRDAGLSTTTTTTQQRALRASTSASTPKKSRDYLALQDASPRIQFPVTDGLRGVSLGTTHFRRKCARHATHFTRCRCVLPVTTTAAHIETLTLALTPVEVAPPRPKQPAGAVTSPSDAGTGHAHVQ